MLPGSCDPNVKEPARLIELAPRSGSEMRNLSFVRIDDRYSVEFAALRVVQSKKLNGMIRIGEESKIEDFEIIDIDVPFSHVIHYLLD